MGVRWFRALLDFHFIVAIMYGRVLFLLVKGREFCKMCSLLLNGRSFNTNHTLGGRLSSKRTTWYSDLCCLHCFIFFSLPYQSPGNSKKMKSSGTRNLCSVRVTYYSTNSSQSKTYGQLGIHSPKGCLDEAKHEGN